MDAEHLEPGEVVAGRFRVEGPLGQGGMGVVYRATQLGLDREVALKVIRPGRLGHPNALERFEREARTASMLKHPGAVEIYDFGESDGVTFLAMQLVDGRNLGDLIYGEGALPEETAVRIASQVADVLVAAEAIGLVHRDLKPDNILLERNAEGEERVVVVDFGLAFIEHRPGVDRLTREGVVTGTPDYMSPEQARGTRLDARADVYALGCILFEMLTGDPPFEGDAVTLLARQIFMAPPTVDERRDGPPIARALSRLVERMLEKEVDLRPRPADVREALEALLEARPERMGLGTTGEIRGRADRMISMAPASERITYESQRRPTGDAVSLRVEGAVDPQLALGLATNGVLLVAQDAPDADAVYAPDATADEVAALVAASKLPVLSAVDASDIERLTGLLRAGAAEALVRPVAPETLAHKIRRAVRAARRRSSKGKKG